MGARILDGKAIAEKVRGEVREGVAAFRAKHGRPPGLDVLLVGEHAPSVVYTRNKERAALEVGLRGTLHRLPESTTEAELLGKITELAQDDTVDGILVQLPLPKTIDERTVLLALPPEKDVDGFHPVNVGRLSTGQASLVPCTPLGAMRLHVHARAWRTSHAAKAAAISARKGVTGSM